MQTIAAIDAGSNAMRMIIGEVDDAWQVEPVGDAPPAGTPWARTSSPGESSRRKRIQQATEAFQHFQRVAQDFGVARTRAIGTSAMREASNGDILLDRISRTSGIEVEVISGAEEARLIHLAVGNVINLKGKRAVLIDIGGGSVEVTISDNENILSTESYNMGTVRLLQKLDGGKGSRFPWFGTRRPFSALVREYAEAARRRIDREIGKARVNVCIGTGGTVEDLGRLHQRVFKKPNDQLVSLGELQGLIDSLSSMSVKDRIRRVRVCALTAPTSSCRRPSCLQLIAHEARVRHVDIPHVGLKDGLLLDMAEGLSKGPQPPRRAQVWESAMQLGKKYHVDAHARGAHRQACPAALRSIPFAARARRGGTAAAGGRRTAARYRPLHQHD